MIDAQDRKPAPPKKALGQHFLTHPDLINRIVDFAGVESCDAVLEIGAGRGHLTGALLARAGRVGAIEIDPDCAGWLTESLGTAPGFRLILADVLDLDLDRMRSGEEGYDKLVANLPYQITGPLLGKLLDMKNKFPSVTLLLQKEVVDRLVAQPGSKEYGALTLGCSYYYHLQRGFLVKPGAFNPPPKVMSSVVGMRLRDRPAVETGDERRLFRLIRAGFAQRRKKIANALASDAGLPAAEVAQRLREAGADPDLRAEMWRLEDFANAVEALSS